MPLGSKSIPSYKDPESGLLVTPLDVGGAFQLVEKMPCVVHLLPKFRIDALDKFGKGSEPDVYLYGCSQEPNGPRTGFILYSVEKGRRGVIKLVCRLMCVEGSSVAAGRALMIPAALMHDVQRIEAKIDKRQEAQREFWQGLGFEIHDETAEFEINKDVLKKPTILSGQAPEPRSAQPAAMAPTAGKKRGVGGEQKAAPKPVKQRIEQPKPPPDYTEDAEAPEDPQEDETTEEPKPDVYIRVTCPGPNEPHLVKRPVGLDESMPRTEWWIVPEVELEVGHTVQCTSCNRVFLVARDEAVDYAMCRPPPTGVSRLTSVA